MIFITVYEIYQWENPLLYFPDLSCGKIFLYFYDFIRPVIYLLLRWQLHIQGSARDIGHGSIYGNWQGSPVD